MTSLKMEAHGRWKGGKRVSSWGYVMVRIPGEKRYEREHRLLMEQHLGRKLKRSEDVHHKNGDKTDNRIENLELLSHSQHSKLHMSGEDHPGAKLKVHQVLEIRRLYAEAHGRFGTIAHLARMFSMSEPAIDHIVKNYRWKKISRKEGALP
jgi:hypothetical protein